MRTRPLALTIEVTAPPLHPQQQQVRDDPRRFRVLVAGRRWGKTRLGAVLAIAEAVQGKRCWWLAPTYGMAMVGWREILALAAQFHEPAEAVIRHGELRVTFPFSGGWVQVRSADDPDKLRGEGLDFVVFDEAALIDPRTWHEVIRPALADRRGRALFISTPRGRNWFWELYQLGERRPEEWAAFHFPTTGNPYVPESEIELARQSLPERVFRQEFLAEFVEEGAVFRWEDIRSAYEAATWELPEPPRQGRRYVQGVDLARDVDWTVHAVLDATAPPYRLVCFERYQRAPYPVVAARIRELHERYACHDTVIDATGVGAAVLDDVADIARGFTFTARSKREAIVRLQVALEKRQLQFPFVRELVDELANYEWDDAGLVTDAVMALALALLAALREPRVQFAPSIWG